MLIFDLVHPGLVGLFLAMTATACVVHRLCGSYQKVPLTFLAIGAITLWLGNEPYAEPFPGAVRLNIIACTVFQALFAAIAFWVRDLQPTK